MDSKEKILKAAQRLFGQFGLKKVTTDEIAKAAGISKATVYKYYDNKQAIFQDVVRMEADQLLAAIKEGVDREASVDGKFRAHLLARIDKIDDLVNFYRVTQDTWGDFWPYLADIGRRFMEEEKKIVGEIMRFGIEKGELSIKHLDLASHISVVALKSVEFPWAIREYNISPEAYAEMMLDMMLNGIRKR